MPRTAARQSHAVARGFAAVRASGELPDRWRNDTGAMNVSSPMPARAERQKAPESGENDRSMKDVATYDVPKRHAAATAASAPVRVSLSALRGRGRIASVELIL